MKSPISTRLVALTLAVSLGAAWIPIRAEVLPASLSGTVRAGAGPLVGARVFVANTETGQAIPAARTDGNGFFTVAALPPATYQLAVETGEGLYVAQNPVPVRAGARRQVDVMIHAEEPAEPSNGTKPAGQGLSVVWNNPLMAAFIVVGAAVVVGVLVDNATDDEDASPF